MNIIVGSTTYVPQRIFCIGRNYREHARELNNEVPHDPIVFMKPATCLVSQGQTLRIPSHGTDYQYEAEMVVVIGSEGRASTPSAAAKMAAGVSLGLDLTMRDIQRECIAKGLPWEISKSFDQSAPIGSFVAVSETVVPDRIEFECHIGNEIRQRGNTAQMIFPVARLIMELSRFWSLQPGDLLYTGTPSGIGKIAGGTTITVSSPSIGSFSWLFEEP